MRQKDRRLAAVEKSLRGGHDPGAARGSLEIHHLDAWPACKDASGMRQCDEHAGACGVQVGPGRGRSGRVVVKLGGPWLGV